MPGAWVISPIVTVDGMNMPKVATFGDKDGRFYAHSSCIYPERGMTWALSYVAGDDLTLLRDDPECTLLFDEEMTELRPTRARCLEWLQEKSPTQLTTLTTILQAKDASAVGLTENSQRRSWLAALGRAASAGQDDFRPEAWYSR